MPCGPLVAQRRGCAGKNLGAHPFFSSITSRLVNAAVLHQLATRRRCVRNVAVMPRAFQNLSWYVTDGAATCLRQQPRERQGVAGNVDSTGARSARSEMIVKHAFFQRNRLRPISGESV